MQDLDAGSFGSQWFSFSIKSLYTSSPICYTRRRIAAFCSQTKEFIHHVLTPDASDISQLPGSDNYIISNFEPIGKPVSAVYSPAQRELLLQQLNYVDMALLEQQVLTSRKVHSVEEYLERRMGSSANGVVLALIEMTDDLHSARRSFIAFLSSKLGQVDTILSLLYLQHGSLQKGVDQAFEMIRSAVAEFNVLSKQFLATYLNDVELHAMLQKYIAELHTKRYHVGSEYVGGDKKPKDTGAIPGPLKTFSTGILIEPCATCTVSWAAGQTAVSTRLPEGMQRISYDADTQVYTYQDADGTLWEGAPGARYGVLKRVQTLPTLPEEVNPPSPSPSSLSTNTSGQFKHFDQFDICQCQCQNEKKPLSTSTGNTAAVTSDRKKHHEREGGRGRGRGRFFAVLFLQRARSTSTATASTATTATTATSTSIATTTATNGSDNTLLSSPVW
ncbi:LysM domain-containing protein [Rasamsonia emersonii CBS 393.64]|uniref:LysM domain-containing protein n=1 Tax=Rasamsonia emersonii (strain ATCC 16479 / CBS 393.64 / IMI 116815) TaxID=1408163 RepID=A0A0F4YUX0_RASE3|nr:LysM domain-containing protein [Rasamsonia emersonii CBS 393.64]KKA22087.1 LysM domain-containing protein [Rasamsonia emersonii CBS 393.64]